MKMVVDFLKMMAKLIGFTLWAILYPFWRMSLWLKELETSYEKELREIRQEKAVEGLKKVLSNKPKKSNVKKSSAKKSSTGSESVKEV